jgi:hypothetical protein
VQRGQRAALKIQPIGWEGFTTALGGGPRLLNNGRVEVTAIQEAFRADVRVGWGRAPRWASTATGATSRGCGRATKVSFHRPHPYGDGLHHAKLGAVDALNLDGGGSSVLAVRNRVVNKPSDGSERSVSNALLVMR